MPPSGNRSGSPGRPDKEDSMSTPGTTTAASPGAGAPSVRALPDYAPVPRSSLGPALNDQGYHVGWVERNLYWVTDGTYQAAFLTTPDGVVLFDAPRPSATPAAGHRPDRRRQRRQHPGDAPGLLPSPRRPRRRGLTVRPRRGPHRAPGDPPA